MQSYRSSPVKISVLLVSSIFGTAFAQQPGAVSASQEKDLNAAGVVTIAPGEHFAIDVPLRPSSAVNLGAAQLDITLTPKVKGKHPVEDLHLIAVLSTAQASLKAGDTHVTLHGVGPEIAAAHSGEYRPSDYSIHLGSGNVTNLGTPDDSLIDTEALTKKVEALRVRLTATAK